MFFQAPWARVRSLASRLSCGVSSQPRRLRVRTDEDPSPGNAASRGRAAGGSWETPYPTPTPPHPREEGSNPGPGDPLFSCGKAGMQTLGSRHPEGRGRKWRWSGSGGHDRRREHRGSDMEAREEVAEKARWLLPFPERGFPGSVGTTLEREKLAPRGPRPLQSGGVGRETRGPPDLPSAAAENPVPPPPAASSFVPGVPRFNF